MKLLTKVLTLNKGYDKVSRIHSTELGCQ